MNAPTELKHLDRQRFLGGSDAAAVLGVSPWATPVDVYLEKTGQAEKVVDPAREKLWRRGKLLEPIVLQMMVEDYGIKVTKVSTPEKRNYHVDHEHPFLAAEIDFEWEVQQADVERWELDPVLLGSIQNGEIKTVHHFASAKFGDAGTEDVPIEYAAQAMDGLMVTGRTLTLFGVLVGADNLSPYFIKRDAATIAAMRSKLVSFWNDHVLARVPPEPTRLEDCFKLWRKAPATKVEATPEIIGMTVELDRAKQAKAAAEDWEVECKYQIGLFMLGASGILLGAKGKLLPTKDTKPGEHLLHTEGLPLLAVALQNQTRIDSDRLREERPEIAAEFSKQISFFRFSKPRGKK